MGNRECEAIASCLRTNVSLQELLLHGNRIEDGGVMSLGLSLTNNRSLKILDLTDNGIGNDGLKELALGLQGNTCLTLLYLGGEHRRFTTRGLRSL